MPLTPRTPVASLPPRCPRRPVQYFTTQKKGEIFELQQGLNSIKKNEKRDAVKKVQ